MTKYSELTFRIDLWFTSGTRAHVEYTSISVKSEAKSYELRIGDVLSGTAGSGNLIHRIKFSTSER